jgi:DNA-binding HxlR family transcriptional regulator
MALGKDYESQDCSVARALELIGERWTLLVIRDAFYGVRRYSDFVAHLDIPRAVLADRLQRLTAAGVLERRRYQEAPPREEYVLTEIGRELWPVLLALGNWGARHLSAAGPSRIFCHIACGTRLGRTVWCSECGTVVPPEEVEMRPGPGADRPRRQDAVSRALRAPRRLLEPLTVPD